jgi:hypothetical protein
MCQNLTQAKLFTVSMVKLKTMTVDKLAGNNELLMLKRVHVRTIYGKY